jgi:hypothetical protein
MCQGVQVLSFEVPPQLQDEAPASQVEVDQDTLGHARQGNDSRFVAPALSIRKETECASQVRPQPCCRYYQGYGESGGDSIEKGTVFHEKKVGWQARPRAPARGPEGGCTSEHLIRKKLREMEEQNIPLISEKKVSGKVLGEERLRQKKKTKLLVDGGVEEEMDVD